MTTHDLKTAPEHFQALLDGTKTAELRKDDRGFAVGDTLLLREWDKTVADDYFARHCGNFYAPNDTWLFAVDAAYTGRELRRVVSHVLHGGPWLVDGYVMLSLKEENNESE